MPMLVIRVSRQTVNNFNVVLRKSNNKIIHLLLADLNETCLYYDVSCNNILLTEITASQKKVILSCHRVCGLYF